MSHILYHTKSCVSIVGFALNIVFSRKIEYNIFQHTYFRARDGMILDGFAEEYTFSARMEGAI